VRSDFSYGIKNLVAVKKPTARRPHPQGERRGLVEGAGQKHNTVPGLRVKSINGDTVIMGRGLPAGKLESRAEQARAKDQTFEKRAGVYMLLA